MMKYRIYRVKEEALHGKEAVTELQADASNFKLEMMGTIANYSNPKSVYENESRVRDNMKTWDLLILKGPGYRGAWMLMYPETFVECPGLYAAFMGEPMAVSQQKKEEKPWKPKKPLAVDHTDEIVAQLIKNRTALGGSGAASAPRGGGCGGTASAPRNGGGGGIISDLKGESGGRTTIKDDSCAYNVSRKETTFVEKLWEKVRADNGNIVMFLAGGFRLDRCTIKEIGENYLILSSCAHTRLIPFSAISNVQL